MRLIVAAYYKVAAVLTSAKKLLLSIVFGLSVLSAGASADSYDVETLSAQQALESGRLLRAQFKNIEARNYLKHAADKGNADAAYLYAMELSNYNTTIRTPPRARDYLLQSANGGNRHAMHHLYTHGDWLTEHEQTYWQQQYHDALVTLGQKDAPQALYELAQYYQPIDPTLSEQYLEMAVDFKQPQALMEKARRYQNGDGYFVLPGARDTQVRKMYLEAAQTGYIPAMRAYISLLEDKGRYKEALQWREKALHAGDLTSLAALGFVYAGQSENYQFVQTDLAKARAYMDTYIETAGTNRLKNLYLSVEESNKNITQRMNVTQKKRAENIEYKLNDNVVYYNHDIFWDI